MTKTQPPVSPFNSQPAVFPWVCLPTDRQAGLPVQRSGSQAPLRRRHHRKSIGAERDLHPYADLSLTKRHTLRGCAALQSA
jgi:hypothetical protein